jgi:hypothetical protein
MKSHRALLFASFMCVGMGLDAQAQPAAPAPPKEYQVQIRYRIQAGRNERVRQFYPMVEFFEALGLKRDDVRANEAEDATLNRMTGTISSAKARRLLEEPHVKSLLLMPPGFKLPGVAEQDNPVKVQIELVGGLPPGQQRLLSEQVRERLKAFGFKEAIAYDHRGFTRLVGTVRGGDVETLLKDLRGEPAGWLAPLTPLADLPLPLRETSPIRVTEVIPEPADVSPIKELPPPAAVAAGQEKITSHVREVMAKEAEAAKPARMEVILVATPSEDSRTWATELAAAVPQLIVEGRYGPIVSVVVPPEKAPALAELPIVSTVRFPYSGAPESLPLIDVANRNREALNASGLSRLHSLGHRGKDARATRVAGELPGVRLAVVGGDFRGWDAMVKAKQLPASTRVLDLTRQHNTSIEPDPYPNDGQTLGHSTQCAMAAALAAPQADLLLIRIDPAAPYQLLAIARYINGDAVISFTMDQRRDELDAAFEDLDQRWKKMLSERKELFEDFNADEEGQKKREDHFRRVKELKEEEELYRARLQRFLQHQRDLRNLQRLQVLVNTLSWPEGHLIDGSGPLAQYINNRPFRSTIWFQPGGDIRGQTWTGLFRDSDGNGVMEFVPPGTALPRGRWTPELNFLAWQPYSGKQDPALLEKTKIRLSIQWREAHDPDYLRRGEDLYREPLAQLRLMLLRQRDPSATKLATDDMELVAYSSGLPQRIDNQPNSATYEQTLEFTIDNPGNYALRVEGRAPVDLRPPGVPSTPASQKQFDLRPRILVEVLDPQSRATGRIVFLDFPRTEGDVGMPGDTQAVVTIGAAGRLDRPEIFSSGGPAMNLELLAKPNFLAYDGLEVSGDKGKGVLGSSLSASFAAGLTATGLGAGVPANALLTPLPLRPGSVLRVPDNWRIGMVPGR